VRKGVVWVCLVVLGSGWVAACATNGEAGGGGGDDGSTGSGDGAMGADGTSSGGDTGHGDDATTKDTGSGNDSSSVDTSFDIAFPDGFSGPDGAGGDGGSGQDASVDGDAGCMPNGITCQGTTAYDCNNGVLTSMQCPMLCADGYGCVNCIPNTGSCNGNVGTLCKGDGSGTVTNNCDPQLGEACNNGACTGDCASVGTSYIGCEYYAVTMSNEELDQSTFDFSVSISNTSANQATILITGPNNYSSSQMLAGNAIQNYTLPWVSALSCSNGGSCNSASATPNTSLVTGGAYHIKSTEPVTAYEFNAYEYEKNVSCASDPNGSPPCHSYTNDAALLIPVNAMTGNYQVMAGATWDFYDTQNLIPQQFIVPGTVVIVGTQANTSVTFTTTGTNYIQTGGGLNANTGGTVTLGAGDVLQISSALDGPQTGYGSDMSGATVTASAPVEVIGGHDCSFVPADNWACDHLEQINFPVETLRSDYLVTAPFNNNPLPNGSTREFVKIVGPAGASLTADPAQAGMPATIPAGGVAWFESTADFHLTTGKPVIVGQFMEGQYQFGSQCNQPGLLGPPDCGDPSMSVAVATAQFRTQYQFIAPPSYYENWVNVIAQTGAQIVVDGNTVGGFKAIGNSGYGVAHYSLCGNGSCNGVHTASGNSAFGIEVYGYGYFTSYMYPGGLNLSR
jgi:hypothetical protein